MKPTPAQRRRSKWSPQARCSECAVNSVREAAWTERTLGQATERIVPDFVSGKLSPCHSGIRLADAPLDERGAPSMLSERGLEQGIAW